MAVTPTHLLNKTVNIHRPFVSVDAGGGVKKDWASYLVGIKAMIQPMSESESRRYGRESNRRMWRVFIPPGYNIDESDRVVFEDDTVSGTTTTRHLDIQEIRNPQQMDVILTIIGEETE